MPATQSVRGIANGHWERSEPRSAWLLLLARLGVVELRMLGDLAREATHAYDSKQRADVARETDRDGHHSSGVAAE